MGGLLVVSGLFAVSCGKDAAPDQPSRPSAARPIAVTSDDEGLPAACRPGSVARRLMEFTEALRDVDEDALARFWGEGFEWFSVTPRRPTRALPRHFVAYGREEAIRQLRAWRGARIRLDQLQVAVRPAGAGADIVYSGAWMGTGIAPAERLDMHGKGFVACDSRTIVVWSMAIAAPGEEPDGRLCPPPRGTAARGAPLVACLRRG